MLKLCLLQFDRIGGGNAFLQLHSFTFSSMGLKLAGISSNKLHFYLSAINRFDLTVFATLCVLLHIVSASVWLFSLSLYPLVGHFCGRYTLDECGKRWGDSWNEHSLDVEFLWILCFSHYSFEVQSIDIIFFSHHTMRNWNSIRIGIWTSESNRFEWKL